MTPLIVWRLRDNKPGHARQTAGLVQALQKLRPLAVHDIEVASAWTAFGWWRKREFPPGVGFAAPQLLLGAGRACQWPLLAARRAFGGRAVYCMRPGLPQRWFDLCLIPRHDGAVTSAYVEPTVGVLNDVQPSRRRTPERTLILVGGPSHHHRWDEAEVLKQIASLIFGSRERAFVISDSRRTPTTTCAQLNQFARQGVEVHHHAAVPFDWLPTMLDDVGQAWVTADSVSMIFEALTAGLGIGILNVPAHREDRISRLSAELVAAGSAISFDAWRGGATLQATPTPLAEALRCAALIVDRWF